MAEAKPRSVEFIGVPSKDGDHLAVDLATFERVSGREPGPDEKIGRDKYMLRLRDWAAALRSTRKVKVKLTVQPV